jgi:hypothetical protein
MENNCPSRQVFNPRELGRLAVVQAPRGNTQLFQRSAVNWFKTGKIMLVLTGVLMAAVWGSPSLHAGIIYTAGTETVGPGGNVSVPITVSSALTGNDVYWTAAGFHLTWNSSVLNLQSTSPISVSLSGTPLGSLTLGNFGSPNAGQLNFSWFSGAATGYQVPDGSTLFTVEFTAVGGPSTTVSFDTVSDIAFTDSTGSDLTIRTPTWNNGGVSVVPEPINWALGLFACVFIGGAAVRWVSNRRLSLQPAQTWRQ